MPINLPLYQKFKLMDASKDKDNSQDTSSMSEVTPVKERQKDSKVNFQVVKNFLQF